jgi:hypothetical protein
LNNESYVPEDIVDRFKSKLNEIINVESQPIIKTEKVAVITIQQRVREKTNSVIGDIEIEIDNFINNKDTTLDVYTHLRTNNILSKSVLIKYQLLLEEIEEALNKSDDQLVEAYSCFTSKRLKEYRNFITKIVEDCERYFYNRTSTRKKTTRKKKQKSAAVLTKRVQYLKEFAPLQLISTDPNSIVGCQVCFLFNIKTNKLSHLVSSSPNGMSIKGTTIINIDEVNSKSKKLRKPQDTIKKVFDGGKTVLKKILQELSTKEGEAYSRLNKDTIILRCIK